MLPIAHRAVSLATRVSPGLNFADSPKPCRVRWWSQQSRGWGLAEGLDPPGPDSNRPHPAARSAGLAPGPPPEGLREPTVAGIGVLPRTPAHPAHPDRTRTGRIPLRGLPVSLPALLRRASASPLSPVRVQSTQIKKPPMRGAFLSGAADRTRTGDTWNHKKGIEATGASRGAGSRGCRRGCPTHTPHHSDAGSFYLGRNSSGRNRSKSTR